MPLGTLRPAARIFTHPSRPAPHDVPLPLGESEGAQPPASPCRGPAKRGPKAMEWTPPPPGAIVRRVGRTHTGCVRDTRGGSMDKVVSIIGIDISKRYFQLHGATAER